MGRSSKEERKKRRNLARYAKAVARGSLFPDEELVMAANPSRFATLPKYVLTVGLYELWRRRNTAVVTNKRILFGRGIFSRIEESVPLKDVMDVTYLRRGANSYAEVAVAGRGEDRSIRFVGPMMGSVARRFASEIQRRS